jgi:hypothetical protein
MKRGRVEFEQEVAASGVHHGNVTLGPQQPDEMPPAYALGPSMMMDAEMDSATQCSQQQQQQLASRLEAMRQQIELDCLAQQRHMAAMAGNGFAAANPAGDSGCSSEQARPSTLKLDAAARNRYNSVWAHCALMIR